MTPSEKLTAILKPCPFCGESLIPYFPPDYPEGYYAHDGNKESLAGCLLRDIKVAAKGCEAWNRRIPEAQALAVIEGDAKDAARYRWLRNGCDQKDSAATRIAAKCYGLEWDERIDAAMSPPTIEQSGS